MCTKNPELLLLLCITSEKQHLHTKSKCFCQLCGFYVWDHNLVNYRTLLSHLSPLYQKGYKCSRKSRAFFAFVVHVRKTTIVRKVWALLLTLWLLCSWTLIYTIYGDFVSLRHLYIRKATSAQENPELFLLFWFISEKRQVCTKVWVFLSTLWLLCSGSLLCKLYGEFLSFLSPLHQKGYCAQEKAVIPCDG